LGTHTAGGDDEFCFGYGESKAYHINAYCSVKSLSLIESKIKDKQWNLIIKIIGFFACNVPDAFLSTLYMYKLI